MNANALVVGLCALSLGATGYVVVNMPKQGGAASGDDRVAELEKKLEAAEKRADAVESLRTQMREMQERMDRRVADVDRRVADAAASAAGATPHADAVSPESAGRPLEDVVADRVEKKVAEKLEAMANRDHARGDDGKWKAPIDELATELKLTDAQKTEAKRIFDNAHDESYVLLKTQRLDGGSLLDDFVGQLKGGVDIGEATKTLFSRILSEKVPGTDRTYLAEYMSLEKNVQDALGRQLGKDQMKRLGSLRVSILEVQTGHDPVGDYVRARLQ